jgi:Mn2+/Fe2+ NRAMP family transporter
MRLQMRTSRFLSRERGALFALLAIVGPGLLAELSDDDPAGITTYSIVGADFGGVSTEGHA